MCGYWSEAPFIWGMRAENSRKPIQDFFSTLFFYAGIHGDEMRRPAFVANQPKMRDQSCQSVLIFAIFHIISQNF